MDHLSSYISNDSIAPLIAIGAVLGTVFGVILRGWTAIKNFFKSLTSIFVIRIEMNDEVTSKVVLAYLLKNYRRNTSGKKIYSSNHNCLRDGKFGYVPFELFGNQTIVFWNGLFPFLFHVTQVKTEEKHIRWGNADPPTFNAALVLLRYTVNVEKIVLESSKDRNAIYWNKTAKRRFFVKKVPDPNQDDYRRNSAGTNLEWFNEGVYKLIGFTPEELGRAMTTSGSAVGNLFFPPHVKNLIEEVGIWHGLKNWYAERGIPWKRGWCLYGPPGTGKTALVRAIAEDLDMPLFVFALGRMTDTDLEKSWNDLQAHTPCIALFEDFDTVFHGRENVYGKPTLAEQIAGSAPPPTNPGLQTVDSGITRGQLSFGCLLNCIDGADKTSGIFTIFTTNHIEKLDAALGQPRVNPDGTVEFISTRPGRIDKAIYLGYMTREDKMLFANKVFANDAKGLEEMKEIIDNNPDKKETPAQFQESCTQLALKAMWDEIESKPKPIAEEIKEIKPPKKGKKIYFSRFRTNGKYVKN